MPSASAPSSDTSNFIRTPPPPKTPCINGACIYGERPGHPFLYHLPVTGDRPIGYSAVGLPAGLVLDPTSGNITGSVRQAGVYKVTFTAKNKPGQDSKAITLIIGPTICLTPPMGWNSWNCFASRIDETKIRSAADAMVKTGLINHGWTYINMDDNWEGKRDVNGNIQGSTSFPDMKGLADYIHGLGLKVGLYSSPGPYTCGHSVASYQHEDQDAQSYADWGIDYLKYDWCSYDHIRIIRRAEKYAEALPASAAEIRRIAAEQSDLAVQYWNLVGPTQKEQRRQVLMKMSGDGDKLGKLYAQLPGPARARIETEEDQLPYQIMRASLDKANRDIVYSFCQYGMGNVWEWGAATGGNTWRVTGDINAGWKSVEAHGFKLKPGMEKWAGPGHWNDPDMLEVGNGTLTPDENYTHMTLWCVLAAPLLIGCDMSKMSPFTVSLFSNDEVLAVDQDSLGKQGYRIKQAGDTEVWEKPLVDGSLAVAFFNRGESPADVSVAWTDLGLQGRRPVRDLWRQRDMGDFDSQYSVTVAPHGAELLKIGP